MCISCTVSAVKNSHTRVTRRSVQATANVIDLPTFTQKAHYTCGWLVIAEISYSVGLPGS